MKYALLLIFFLPVLVTAQENCYQTFYQRGLKHMQGNKFDAAIKSFKAANFCQDKPADNDAEAKILEAQNGYIDAIEKERNKARSLALTAKSILELEKNNDPSKAFRYAQYALQMDDNSDSRAAFYESAYQIEYVNRRLFYKYSFPAFNFYPHDLVDANFLGTENHFLAYSTLGQLMILDQNGKVVSTQETSGSRGNPTLFQSSGNLVAFLDPNDERLLVADLGDAKNFDATVFSAFEKDAGISSYRFSPDGKLLAVGFDNGVIQLLDRSGEHLQLLQHGKKRIEYLSFSEDNQLLAASDANSYLQLWNTAGTLVDTIPVSRGYDIAVEISPDKRHLLVKTTARKLKLINLKGENIYQEDNQYGHILPENFSPDGKFVAIDNKLINLNEGSSYGEIFQELGNNVNQIRYSKDGKFLLATGKDEKAYLWKMWGGWRLHAVLGSHSDRIVAAKFSEDGKYILTAGKENVIKIWPLEIGIANYHYNAGNLLQAQFRADSVYVTTNSDNALKLYNAHSGWYATWELPVKNMVCQSDDGKYLLAQEEEKAGIWTFGIIADSLNWIAGVSGFDNMIKAAFSPKEKLVAIYNDNNSTIGLSVWDFKNHQTRFLSGWSGEINTLQWTPDGKTLFAGSMNGEMYAWDCSKGLDNISLKTNIKPHASNPVQAIATSRDGRYLVTSSIFGSDIKIFDSKHYEEIMLNCQCQANTIHFSPDARFFVTAEDKTTKIRDAAGNLITNLNIGNIEVKAAYFSSDGSYVVANYQDGSISIWPFDPKLIIQQIDGYNIPDIGIKEKEKYGITKIEAEN